MIDTQFNFPKAIYKRDEISVAEYLMSLRKLLTDEFMAGFETLEEAVKSRGSNSLDRSEWGIPIEYTSKYIRTLDVNNQEYTNNIDSWKAIEFRYKCDNLDEIGIIDQTMEEDHAYAKFYPTAYNLIKKYGRYCPIANYSIMAPNSVLLRHTGPENRQGKYVRIHIPLIIPEGDIFLEVNGEEVNWSDIFAFNNQLPHSSHNLSSEYRLIFLIDLEREFIGMNPGSVYDNRIEKYAKPFLRNNKEWHLYKED